MSETAYRPGSTFVYRPNASAGTGREYNKFLLGTAPAMQYKPSWNKTLTTFRILPVPDESGNIPPTFTVDAYGNPLPTNWVRAYPAFVGGLEGKTTGFILYDPEFLIGGGSYDVSQNPAWKVYNAVEAAVAAGTGAPHWAPLLTGRGKKAAIAKPDMMYFFQVALYTHKGDPMSPPRGLGPTDKVVVMVLTRAAAETLMQLLLHRANPSLPGARQEFPDPVALDQGLFIHMCELGGVLGQQAVAQGTANSRMQKGFNVTVSTTLADGTTPNVSQHVQLIRSRVKPWDQLLHFPSDAEQALYLARSLPGDVVEYAFRDAPRLFTPEVREATAANAVATTTQYSPSFNASFGPGVPVYPTAGGMYPAAAPNYPPQGYPQSYPQSSAPAYPQAGPAYPPNAAPAYPGPVNPGQPAYPAADPRDVSTLPVSTIPAAVPAAPGAGQTTWTSTTVVSAPPAPAAPVATDVPPWESPAAVAAPSQDVPSTSDAASGRGAWGGMVAPVGGGAQPDPAIMGMFTNPPAVGSPNVREAAVMRAQSILDAPR